jgi:hypothetical protein
MHWEEGQIELLTTNSIADYNIPDGSQVHFRFSKDNFGSDDIPEQSGKSAVDSVKYEIFKN